MTIVANRCSIIRTPDGDMAWNRMQSLHDYIAGTLARVAGGVTVDAGLAWTVTHASAIDGNKLTSPLVGAGGTGYSIGDTGLLAGGTFSDAAEYRVTAESAGVVTAVEVFQTGVYSVNPSFPATTTVGTGTGNAGLTLNGTMAAHAIGTYSFSIQASDGEREICWVNAGSKASPDDTLIKSGVNPSGSSNPILDSAAPWLSATQFAGSSLSNMATTWQFRPGTENREFAYIEYDDATIILSKNSTRTLSVRGCADGRHLDTPQYAVAPGATRVDGNLSVGFETGFRGSSDQAHWMDSSNGFNSTVQRRVRVGTGQAIAIAPSAGWAQTIRTPGYSTIVGTAWDIGPDVEYLPLLWAAHLSNGENIAGPAPTYPGGDDE